MINHAIDLFVAKVNSGFGSTTTTMEDARRQYYVGSDRCWTLITED
jgi:hypothetical protein